MDHWFNASNLPAKEKNNNSTQGRSCLFFFMMTMFHNLHDTIFVSYPPL